MIILAEFGKRDLSREDRQKSKKKLDAMASRFCAELTRLCTVAERNSMDTSISYHTEIEQLSTILGMTCRHLPQMPRLECGYNPYHPRNAEALLDVFREFDSLIIRRKRKTRRRPDNYILMADCVDALRNIRNDVASIMLDERLSGYVIIGLNHLRSLPAWANSPFHLKTWEELESLQNNSESSAQGFHDLVVQIAEESGLEIKTIKDWIHLASASPLASQDPFVQDAIDEHNMCNGAGLVE